MTAMAQASSIERTQVFSHHDFEVAAFSVDQSLRYLNIGRTKFYEEVNAGRIKPRRAGGRTLVLRSDLDAWLAKLPVREVT